MHIKIVAVGKLKEKYWQQAIEEYAKRLKVYCKLSVIEVADEKTSENMSDTQIKQLLNQEASRLLSKIKDNEYVVALAIEGDLMTSETFAKQIETQALLGQSNLTYVIGGSLGLSESVKKRANQLVSFGRMTLPHQLMRVVLIEQVYRAYRIINNHAYHK